MCNAVSTSEWQVLKKGDEETGAGVWRPEGGNAGSAATVMPPLCRESQGYKQLILMYTGYFTLDSPLYLTDFHIVTNSVCLRARVCVCVYVCGCVNFYFLAIPLFVICWVFCSVCIIGKSLIFLLLWKWMIFDLLKKYTFCGFCLTTQINFSLWKGLESKRRARI